MTVASVSDYRDWKSANWKQRAFMVVLFGIDCVVVAAMFVGAIVVLAMILDGIGTYQTNLVHCQQEAETPYEYHKCR